MPISPGARRTHFASGCCLRTAGGQSPSGQQAPAGVLHSPLVQLQLRGPEKHATSSMQPGMPASTASAIGLKQPTASRLASGGHSVASGRSSRHDESPASVLSADAVAAPSCAARPQRNRRRPPFRKGAHGTGSAAACQADVRADRSAPVAPPDVVGGRYHRRVSRLARVAALITALGGACTTSAGVDGPEAPTPVPNAPPAAPASSRVEGDASTGVSVDDVPPDASDAAAEPSPCGADMILVAGDYCTQVVQRCLRRRQPWQCAEFEAPTTCVGATTTAMRYCIDRFEWPNHAGELPSVMNSWHDAKASCEGAGKRLCTEAEWTLACEGPERLPFPYGYARDAQICAIDKRSPRVNEARLFSTRTQAAELERLDQREPSGSRPKCVSAFGVFDLTGSVDELVRNEAGRPYKSALKGGNWGEYRNACRPSTRGHDEGWRYYQTGFRCCREAPP